MHKPIVILSFLWLLFGEFNVYSQWEPVFNIMKAHQVAVSDSSPAVKWVRQTTVYVNNSPDSLCIPQVNPAHITVSEMYFTPKNQQLQIYRGIGECGDTIVSLTTTFDSLECKYYQVAQVYGLEKTLKREFLYLPNGLLSSICWVDSNESQKSSQFPLICDCYRYRDSLNYTISNKTRGYWQKYRNRITSYKNRVHCCEKYLYHSIKIHRKVQTWFAATGDGWEPIKELDVSKFIRSITVYEPNAVITETHIFNETGYQYNLTLLDSNSLVTDRYYMRSKKRIPMSLSEFLKAYNIFQSSAEYPISMWHKTYVYRFDEFGNWIIKMVYSNGELESTTQREFEYYH